MAKKWSFEEIREAIYAALPKDKDGYRAGYIESLYSDEVVISKNGVCMKADYSMIDGAAVFGEWVEVVKKIEYQPVKVSVQFFAEFSGGSEIKDDDIVVKTGKIFEAGDYPDKNFSITEEELDQAVAKFSPVANYLEHIPTILDGELGGIRKVWRKGKELFGEVAIPGFLARSVAKRGEPLKVSLGWDRLTKTIAENSLVLQPRINDAAVFAAFSKNARVPSGSTEKPKMKRTLKELLLARFGIKADKPEDINLEQEVTETEAETPPTPTPATVPTPEVKPEFSSDPRVKALEEQNAQFAESLVRTRAKAFADALVLEGKVSPAQAENVAAMFSEAVRADGGGKVSFSKGAIVEGEAVARLETFFKDQPKRIGDAVETVPFTKGGSGSMSEERKAELMKSSTLGRAAMTAKAKKAE